MLPMPVGLLAQAGWVMRAENTPRGLRKLSQAATSAAPGDEAPGQAPGQASEPQGLPQGRRTLALWLGAACIVGGAAGALVGYSATISLALLGVAVVVAAFWRLEIGLLVLLLTLPLDLYGQLITSPVTVTVFHVALLLVLASWCVRVFGKGSEWLRFSWLDVGIAVLMLAALWSLPHSLAPSATVFSIVRLLGYWAFTLLYTNGVRTEQQLQRIYLVLGITGVVIGVLALVQYRVPDFSIGNMNIMTAPGGMITLRRPSVFFEDPNYLGGFLSVCMIAAAALLVHARSKRWAVAWLVIALVTGIGLVVTFSRGAWLGALLGIVVVVLTAPKSRRRPLIAVGLALVIAASLSAPRVIVSRISSMVNVDRDTSVATRYYMYFSAVDIIKDNWVWGTGLTAFEDAYPAYRRPGTLLIVSRPHQLPLSMWAEMGIVGLAAEVILTLVLVRMYWRKRPLTFSPWESAALAATVTLLLQTFFQYFLYFQYLWLVLALGVVATRLERTSEGGRQ